VHYFYPLRETHYYYTIFIIAAQGYHRLGFSKQYRAEKSTPSFP
jgi:hypothetical protein